MLNLTANIASVLVAVILGFFFTPFLMHHLGPASFAMLPIATTIISYFSLFSHVVASAVSRQLSLAVHGKHSHSVATVFLTGGRASRLLALILLPAIVCAAFLAPAVLSTPAGNKLEVSILMIAVGISLLANLFAVRDSSMLIAKNCIYVDAFATIIQTVLRIGVATALLLVFEPRLWFVAAGLIVGSVIAQSYRAIMIASKFPETRDVNARYEASIIRAAGFTASGVGIGRVSNLVLLSSDVIIVNLLFGATESGFYAAVLQIALLLRLAGTNIAMPFSPTVLNRFNAGDVEGSVEAARSSVRAVGNMLAIPTGLLLGAHSVFLVAWLGSDFAPHSNYLIIMLVLLPATASSQPLLAIILAADRNRVSGLAVLAFGFLHLGAGYTLAVLFDLGPIGIALSATIVIALKGLVFIPLFVARICARDPGPFFLEFLPPLLVLFVTTLATKIAIAASGADSLVRLALIFMPVALFSTLLAFALTKEADQAIVIQNLRSIGTKAEKS